jgi:CubicO group peptidase (beta-lactamase class C family)
VSHGGSWAAFRTHLVHFPEESLGVVVLANHTPFNASAAANRIADIYLGAETGADAPVDEAQEEEDPTEPIGAEPSRPPAEPLVEGADDYLGVYRLGPGWYVRITRDGDQLFAQATDEDRVPMEARSASRFWVEDYAAPIDFHRDETGTVRGFGYRGMEAPKLEDRPAPGPDELRELLGTYYSRELDTSYEIVLEEGGLGAVHQRNGTFRLTHAWGDDFRSSFRFIRSVEFLRDEDGQVEGLLMNGGERVRNLFFRRSRW